MGDALLNGWQSHVVTIGALQVVLVTNHCLVLAPLKLYGHR